MKESGRWTLIGGALGGGLFLALSMYRSIASGGPSLTHLNPIGVMTVIGATVGALVGPLMGGIAARRRSVRSNGGPIPRASTAETVVFASLPMDCS